MYEFGIKLSDGTYLTASGCALRYATFPFATVGKALDVAKRYLIPTTPYSIWRRKDATSAAELYLECIRGQH